MKPKIMVSGKHFLFTSLAIFMGIILLGCTETFPLENVPDSLTYLEYNRGSISKQSEVRKGEPSYDALYSFLQNNQAGWSPDINSYVPSLYFKSELITINCGDDFVVINYKPKNRDQWMQVSKTVKGCKAAIINAQATK